MSAFDLAFEILIGHEGGYVDDPRDAGGETKFGISKRSHPTVDIAGLTLDGAKQLYRAEYWDKMECDLLDPGFALLAFDAAVNNGVGSATKWLQTALGVPSDGVIGPQTRAAMQKAKGQAALDAMTALHAQRINFMASLPSWPTFGKGWSRRLAQLPFQASRMEV